MVKTTAGRRPELAWLSRQHGTRADAASLEAALKHMMFDGEQVSPLVKPVSEWSYLAVVHPPSA